MPNPFDAGVPHAIADTDAHPKPVAVSTACAASTAVRAARVLTVCADDGLVEHETTCALGCFSDGSRCEDVNPPNGLGIDLDFADAEPGRVLPDGSTINIDTGIVTTSLGTVEVANALIPAPADGLQVRVFMIRSIRIGHVDVAGTPALAIVLPRNLTIDGALNAGGSSNLNAPGAYGTGDGVGSDARRGSVIIIDAPGPFEPTGGSGGGFGSAGA